MSPIARDNFSCWFSFHLTNTDYQWPHSQWDGWTVYLVEGMAVKTTKKEEEESVGTGGEKMMQRKRNSRGECVANTIQTMVTYVSSPKTILEECLPANSPLGKFLYGGIMGNGGSGGGDIPTGTIMKSNEDATDPTGNENNSKTNTGFATALALVEKELNDRVWNKSDDPDTVRDLMIGGEISESVQGTIDIDDQMEGSSSLHNDENKIWWRTGLAVRSLLRPVVRDYRMLLRMVGDTNQNSSAAGVVDNNNHEMMDDDDNINDYSEKEDVLTDIVDALSRYRSVIMATLAKDVQVHEENLDLRGETKKSEIDILLTGEVYVLRQCEKLASYSSVVLQSCVETCVKQKIVSVMGVLWWVLDEGNNRPTSDDDMHVVLGWWKLASSALQIGVDGVLSSSLSAVQSLGTDGGIGMIIDSGGDGIGDANAGLPSARRMKVVTDYAGPLLNYASSRVNKILTNDDQDSNSGTAISSKPKKKQMLPVEVDLVEGLKYLIRSTSSYIISALKSDLVVKATTEFGGAVIEVENWVAKCELGTSGANL